MCEYLGLIEPETQMLQYNNLFIFFSLLYIFILLKTFKQLLLQKYHLFLFIYFFLSFPVFSLMPTRQTLHPCSLS